MPGSDSTVECRVYLALMRWEEKTDTHLTHKSILTEHQFVNSHWGIDLSRDLALHPLQGPFSFLHLPSNKNIHTWSLMNSGVISSRPQKRPVISPCPKVEPPSLETTCSGPPAGRTQGDLGSSPGFATY